MELEEFLAAIGKSVKELRIKNCPDRSVTDLAGQANKNKKAWDEIEEGLANPNMTTLNKMAKVLGVSIDDLFKFVCKKKR